MAKDAETPSKNIKIPSQRMIVKLNLFLRAIEGEFRHHQTFQTAQNRWH